LTGGRETLSSACDGAGGAGGAIIETGNADDKANGPRPAGPGRWRFAAFELDEATSTLRRDDRHEVLDRSSFDVLVALLRHAGEVVGKQALLDAGWPGRVVSDNSLNKAIGRLRHALEDPDARLLATAHGYGYRLAAHAHWSAVPVAIAPVATQPAMPAVPGPPPAAGFEASSGTTMASGGRSPDVAPRPRARPPRAWATGLALAVAVAGLAFVARHREEAVPVGPVSAASAPSATPAAAPEAAPIGDGPSVAVLPFVDLSQARDQRYFSDGLADELLDRLAKLPQLRVASRTSSWAFRDSGQDIRAIGRKLRVSTVLEGSVRRDGDRVRITVQLIKASDGFHLWSETYDKRMTDLFAVQDDIARSVVAALRLELLPGQDLAVTRHRTRSMAAFEQYLAAQRLRAIGSADHERRAIAAYERAIALDPEFSTAYAALADLLGGDANYAETPAEVAAGKLRSIALMDRAIALEPDNTNFYLARADLLYYTRRDWHAAQRDLDTAARLLRRRPPELLVRQCRLLAVLGRLDDAIRLERTALDANPEHWPLWGMLGYHLASAGRAREADAALAHAVRGLPDDDHVNYYIGLSRLLQGRAGDAVDAFDRSGSVFRLAGLAIAEHSAGHAERSQAALDALEARYGQNGAYQVAQVHAWRGEPEAAFHWLHRADLQHDAGLAQLKFDPLMRPLRRDPRFASWLKRLGLAG
jgi:TolB-like protein/DNA-binding winged helix-turn-helix (wHTH) protein